MVGQGIGKSRLGHIAAYQEEKRKLADLANVQNPAPEKLARPDAVKPIQEASPTVMPQADVNNPALDKMTWKNTGIVPMAGQGEYRTEALRDMNEEQFKANQGRMNASEYEYWTEQLKANPGSEYAIVNQMLASKETPAEKAKRERREQLGEVFNNLGSLIGNAANLYYTHRGGQYIDLNTANEKHRERMQRIKDKQDALDEQRKQLILNAKLSDVKAARAERAAKEKRVYDEKLAADKAKADQKLAELKYLQEMGVITAKQAGELAKIKTQYEYDTALAKLKHGQAVALKQTPGYGENDVQDSAMDDKGNIWTRTKKLTDNELRQIAQSSPMYHKYEFQEMFKDKKTGKIDHRAMASYLMANKQVPASIYEQMGFDEGKSSNNDEGFSYGGVKNEGFSIQD